MTVTTPYVADEELRLALVMNWGVSLAVWMGGVTSEIARFHGETTNNSSETSNSVYDEIRALMSTRVRVDIICGTSAGGINGTYLGLAIARHGQAASHYIDRLRDIWINHGALDALVRDPFNDKPASILDGEGVFTKVIREALEGIPDATIRNRGEPLALLVTTTLLRGARKEISDVFGNRLTDISHHGVFEFVRGEEGPDPFVAQTAVDQLVVAARSTASFPGAFEPHFVRVGTKCTDGTKPDMSDIANFGDAGFVTDGGVLNNSPIDRALDLIFKQRAGGPVRRVLAFVVPDPAPGLQPENIDPKDLPGMLDVALDTMVRIPRVQSVATQIEELRLHNERVRQRRRDRILLTSTVELDKMELTAGILFKTYRAQRVQSAVKHIIDRIDLGLSKTESDGLGRRGRRAWLVNILTELGPSLPFVPSVPPGSTSSRDERLVETWRWGALPVQHMARLFLDLVARTQRVANYAHTPPDLVIHWRAAFEAIEAIERVRTKDRGRWPELATELHRLLGGPSDARATAEARIWLGEAVRRWQKQPPIRDPDADSAGEVAHRIAEGILSLAEVATRVLENLGQSTDDVVRRDMAELGGLIRYFFRNADDAPDNILERLLILEVIQEASGPTDLNVEQEIDYVQISADQPSAFGGPRAVTDRLTGLQLAHFGAFYKGSWRANDWLWGRLDAVRRLVLLLMDPARMQVVARKWAPGTRARTMTKLIEAIALGPSDSAQYPVLKAAFLADRIEDELKFLDESDRLMPERLIATTDALIRRLHLDILTEELPQVAKQIKVDSDQGSYPVNLRRLAGKIEESTDNHRLDPAKASQIMHGYCVGSQRLVDEVGTDRMGVLAAQVLAVSIAALRREADWFWLLGKFLTTLRVPTLAVYILFEGISRRGSLSRSIATNVIVVAGVIVITHLFSQTYYTSVFVISCAIIISVILWYSRRILPLKDYIIFSIGCIMSILSGLYWVRIVTPPSFTVGGREFSALILASTGTFFIWASLRSAQIRRKRP